MVGIRPMSFGDGLRIPKAFPNGLDSDIRLLSDTQPTDASRSLLRPRYGDSESA